MSKITEILKNYAEEEKRAHEEYIRDFSTATIAHLVQGGVDRDKAGQITKEACLRDDELVKSVNRSIVLEKAAEYIESLEAQNAEFQVKINEQASTSEQEKQAEVPEHLRKLEKIGFTMDEIRSLENVPQSVITKVASAASEPYELGRGVGPANLQTDPLLDWIMN